MRPRSSIGRGIQAKHVGRAAIAARAAPGSLALLRRLLTGAVFATAAVSGFSAVVINEIHFDPKDEIDGLEFIELFNAGPGEEDLSGWRIRSAVTYDFPPGVSIPASGYLVIAEDPAALRHAFGASALGPFQGRLSNDGETIRLIDAHNVERDAVSYGAGFPWPSASVGQGASLELIRPDLDNALPGHWQASGVRETVDLGARLKQLQSSNPGNLLPSPGRLNRSFALTARPTIAEARRAPQSPTSDERPVITARVSSPQGPTRAALQYQAVPPGGFIPAYLPLPRDQLLFASDLPYEINPAFIDDAAWTQIPMRDDGQGADANADDGRHSAALPAFPHRTLVRYRVLAMNADAENPVAAAPRADDPSVNFAYFVYNGAPAYRVNDLTVLPEGPGAEHAANVMNSLPIYHLMTREGDFMECHGYDPNDRIPKTRVAARSKFNWEGALVYDGTVYDHIRYRLRQSNDRYNGSFGGRRSLRFAFPKTRRFRPRDNQGTIYPEGWRRLNLGKMFDNKRVRNFGLTESMNSWLWNLVGVPAPRAHYVQLRVVDDAEEAPEGPGGQYHGDFWGVFLAMEDYDGAFLRSRGLPDGNLYKLKDGVLDPNELKRNQGREAPQNGEDFENIRQRLRPTRSERWLRDHVDYAQWSRYNAVNEAIRHYDYAPNDAFSKNRAWFFDRAGPSAYGRLWVLPWDSDASWGPSWGAGLDYPKQAIYSPPGKPTLQIERRNTIRAFRSLVWRPEVIHRQIDYFASLIAPIISADRDRWIAAPFGVTLPYGPLEDKVADMKAFAFSGWTEPAPDVGPDVPDGGRARHLERLAAAEPDGPEPRTPLIAYEGPAGFPAHQLSFRVSAFLGALNREPPFALQWRLAEVDPPGGDGGPPRPVALSEWNALWTSEPSRDDSLQWKTPIGLVQPDRLYRVRARASDAAGRWSYWSAPTTFEPARANDSNLRGALRISEILFNPPESEALEYVEILNASDRAAHLASFYFSAGIEFHFSESFRKLLPAGERLLVARDADALARRFPHAAPRIAGEFQGRLSNGGERLELSVEPGAVVFSVDYDDDWADDADGEGSSLTARALPNLEPAFNWSQAAAWTASRSRFGTPGTQPTDGDADGDGMADDWERERGLDPLDAGDGGQPLGPDSIRAYDLAVLEGMRAAAAAQSRLEASLRGDWLQLRVAPMNLPGHDREAHRIRCQFEQREEGDADWRSSGPPVSAGEHGAQILLRKPEDGQARFYRCALFIELRNTKP